MLYVKKLSQISLTLAALTVVAACSGPASNSSTASAPAPAPVAQTTSAVVASGTFSGRSDHVTTGHVALEKTATGYQLNFASDFSLDGAPDPIVAIGNGDTYVAANKVSVLENKTGAQSYTLPAGFTPGQFSQVYVWCEKFNVPLGIANLN